MVAMLATPALATASANTGTFTCKKGTQVKKNVTHSKAIKLENKGYTCKKK
jgi:hypothetical protein